MTAEKDGSPAVQSNAVDSSVTSETTTATNSQDDLPEESSRLGMVDMLVNKLRRGK